MVGKEFPNKPFGEEGKAPHGIPHSRKSQRYMLGKNKSEADVGGEKKTRSKGGD